MLMVRQVPKYRPVRKLKSYPSADPDNVTLEHEHFVGQTIIDCLTIVRSLAPTIHASLHDRMTSLFPYIIRALKSPFAIIRQSAAQCIATLCNVMTITSMRIVVEEIIPLLGDVRVLTNKQGAIEVVFSLYISFAFEVRLVLTFLILRHRETPRSQGSALHHFPHRACPGTHE